MSEPILIKDAIADDSNPERQKVAIDFLDKLERGEIKLCAPFPGMKEPWSQEDIDRLQAALKTMHPQEIPPMVNPIDWEIEYISEYIADEKRDLLNEVNSEIKLDDDLDD